jgi:hypothetical protein
MKFFRNAFNDLCIPDLHEEQESGNETTRERAKNYLVVEQKLSLGQAVV